MGSVNRLSESAQQSNELVALDAAEARLLTDQIKAAVDAVWPLIVRAYIERAWEALGYGTWDDYCKYEFSTMKLRIPREEREAVVPSLRDSGLSTRAIASALGCSQDTVNRALRERNRSPDNMIDDDTFSREPLSKAGGPDTRTDETSVPPSRDGA